MRGVARWVLLPPLEAPTACRSDLAAAGTSPELGEEFRPADSAERFSAARTCPPHRGDCERNEQGGSPIVKATRKDGEVMLIPQDEYRDRYLFARDLRKRSTSAEIALWQQLRGRRTHGFKFRRQHVMGPFIVDFVCLERSLVIEVDGGIHRVTEKYDADRTRWLEGRGFRVIRFSNDEVMRDEDAVIQEILKQLAAPPGPFRQTERKHYGFRRSYWRRFVESPGGTPPGLTDRTADGLNGPVPPIWGDRERSEQGGTRQRGPERTKGGLR